MRKRNRMLGAIALVAIVVASGCLTVSIDSTVNDDGTIDRYETRMEVPAMVLDQMNQSAQEDDMSLEESIRQGYDDDNYGSISVDVRTENQQGIIEIVLEDFDPDDIEGSDFSGGESQGEGNPDPSEQAAGPQIDVTVEEDRITYVDDSFDSDTSTNGTDGDGEFSGSFSLQYTLTMPGPIIEDETNADEIDGRTATWNESGSDVLSNTEIRAASERSSGGGSFLGLPGFGAGLALVALLVGAGLLTAARKRNDD